MSPKKTFSYDKAVSRIEEIVRILEENDNNIDQLSDLVKEASTLIKGCKSKLKMTEEDIKNAFNEEDS